MPKCTTCRPKQWRDKTAYRSSQYLCSGRIARFKMWAVWIIASTCRCFSELLRGLLPINRTVVYCDVAAPYVPCFRRGVFSATLASFGRLVCLRQNTLLLTKKYWLAKGFWRKRCSLSPWIFMVTRLKTGWIAQLLPMRDSWGCRICWRAWCSVGEGAASVGESVGEPAELKTLFRKLLQRCCLLLRTAGLRNAPTET